MSRAYTQEEARRLFLVAVRDAVVFWTTDSRSRGDVQAACDGVAFSILNIFDGGTMTMPTLDIVLRPHPSDEAYCKELGENWLVDGMVINADAVLHKAYSRDFANRGPAAPREN